MLSSLYTTVDSKKKVQFLAYHILYDLIMVVLLLHSNNRIKRSTCIVTFNEHSSICQTLAFITLFLLSISLYVTRRW